MQYSEQPFNLNLMILANSSKIKTLWKLEGNMLVHKGRKVKVNKTFRGYNEALNLALWSVSFLV